MSLSTSSSEWRFAIRWSVCFAAMIALIAGATEWLVRAHVAPQDNFLAHARLLTTSQTPNAAFGDSHVARGFAPPENMVNLAFPSENIPQISDKVQDYFADHAPGRVVLQADPHLFAPYRLVAQGSKAQDRFAREMAGPFIAVTERRPALRAYWAAFIAGGGSLTSQIEQTPSGALLSPGNLAEMSPRALDAEVRRRATYHHPYDGPSAAQARQTYAAMLDSLISKGAEVCLVSFPVSPPYLEAVQAKAAEAIAFYQREAARVGARYVDHRAIFDDLGKFRDVDHLNKAGALEYSPTLLSACFSDQEPN